MTGESFDSLGALLMTEKLTQKCGCGACDRFLPEKAPAGHGDRPFCSQRCADHAGGEMWRAEADHAQEG